MNRQEHWTTIFSKKKETMNLFLVNSLVRSVVRSLVLAFIILWYMHKLYIIPEHSSWKAQQPLIVVHMQGCLHFGVKSYVLLTDCSSCLMKHRVLWLFYLTVWMYYLIINIILDTKKQWLMCDQQNMWWNEMKLIMCEDEEDLKCTIKLTIFVSLFRCTIDIMNAYSGSI